MVRIPLTDNPVEADKQPVSEIKNPARISNEEIPVPYLDYHNENGKPYLVEHFNLGDTWDDPAGGFPKEIQTIEKYINKKIDSGLVPNSVTGVKEFLKGIEKFNNLTKEERAVVKLEVIAHYVEFMEKNEETRANLRRYNGTR